MMKQHHEQAFVRPERTTPRKAYEAALADFRPGATWAGLEARQGKPTFVFWGKAAGMSADEIIADVHAAGVRNRDADIRRAWKTAHPQGDRPQASWTRTLATKPNPPPTFPHYVRDMVASGGNEATSADLLDVRPCRQSVHIPRRRAVHRKNRNKPHAMLRLVGNDRRRRCNSRRSCRSKPLHRRGGQDGRRKEILYSPIMPCPPSVRRDRV